jgi:hypothetical protein
MALIIAIGIIFYSVLLPVVWSWVAASSIKDGQRAKVEVRYRSFKGSAGQVIVPGLVLIGATQRASFFYDRANKRTLVIPQTQLISIEVPE